MIRNERNQGCTRRFWQWNRYTPLIQSNAAVRDYYLLPWIDLGPQDRVRWAETNGVSLDAYRFDGLDLLYDIATPIPLAEAA